MITIEFKDLLKKYIDDCITIQELRRLEQLLEQLPEKDVQEIIFSLIHYEDVQLILSDEQMNEKLSIILNSLMTELSISTSSKVRPINKIFIRVFVGIAATLLCVLGILFYLNSKETIENITVNEEIDPARSFAMVTLVNGDSIDVDATTQGLIYNKRGIKIFKTANGEFLFTGENSSLVQSSYLMVSTPKGGFTKLRLSDGTEVFLNANSKLKYPVRFDKNVRKVYAEGELFFDVTKNVNKPFVIHSERQVIEVLGTTFNLYTNKDVERTTLLEGLIKITADEKGYILKPGQQAIVSNTVKIIDVKVEEAIGWRDGYFTFDNASFLEIVQEVEDWYNVKVVFETEKVIDIKLSGTVSRKIKLAELLKVLEINTAYTFKIQGRRVLIK